MFDASFLQLDAALQKPAMPAVVYNLRLRR
jgi:hypothetical protein